MISAAQLEPVLWVQEGKKAELKRLEWGESIRTAQQEEVELRLSDGTWLRLAPNSELELLTPRKEHAVLRLHRGAARARTGGGGLSPAQIETALRERRPGERMGPRVWLILPHLVGMLPSVPPGLEVLWIAGNAGKMGASADSEMLVLPIEGASSEALRVRAGGKLNLAIFAEGSRDETSALLGIVHPIRPGYGVMGNALGITRPEWKGSPSDVKERITQRAGFRETKWEPGVR